MSKINRFNFDVYITYNDEYDDDFENNEASATFNEVEDEQGRYCFYSDVEAEIVRLNGIINDLKGGKT